MDAVGASREIPIRFEPEELNTSDIVEVFDSSYSSAIAEIRAVGKILGQGRKVKNLNTAVSVMENNLGQMKEILAVAKQRFQSETHWFCGRPKSEIQAFCCSVGSWVSGSVATALAIDGLSGNNDESLTVIKTVAILALGVFQFSQGWLASSYLQQKAAEEALLLLLQSSSRKMRYIESMINSFRAWESYQVSDGQAEDESIQEFIRVLDTLPSHPKGDDAISRRDLLGKFLNTHTGRRLLNESHSLRTYKKLVEREYAAQASKLKDERDADFEEEEEEAITGVEESPHVSMRSGSGQSDVLVSAEQLSGYQLDNWCFRKTWDIGALSTEVNRAYQIGESEITSVGGAIKQYGEGKVDFQAGIEVLSNQVRQLELLERISQHILGLEKSIPSVISLQSQQRYRSIITVILTVFSFGSSAAETAIQFTQTNTNTTLLALTLITLLGSMFATLLDQRLRARLFKALKSQGHLKDILAKRCSKNLAAMVRVWTRYQRAIETGEEEDVRVALQTRIPRALENKQPRIEEIGERLIAERQRLEGVSQEEACAADESFATCVRKLVSKDNSPPKTSCLDAVSISLEPSPAPALQSQFVWGSPESTDEDDVPEGDWVTRLQQLRKIEAKRREQYPLERETPGIFSSSTSSPTPHHERKIATPVALRTDSLTHASIGHPSAAKLMADDVPDGIESADRLTDETLV